MSAELVLGTAQLGSAYGVNNQAGELDDASAFAVLDSARDCGVSLLDTAEAYGRSQEVIGHYLRKSGRSQFRVCTKLSAGFDYQLEKIEGLKHRIKASSDVMSGAEIDVYYLHSFDMCKDSDLLSAMSQLRDDGYFGDIGVSVYEPEELLYVINNLKDVIGAVQIPFNVFNCYDWLNDGLLSRAADSVRLFVRSVYLQGLAFKEPNDSMVNALGITEALSAFANRATEQNVSRAKLACDFVRSYPEIGYIVLGSETSEQVEENAAMFQDDNTWDTESLERQLLLSKTFPKEAVDPRLWPSLLEAAKK